MPGKGILAEPVGHGKTDAREPRRIKSRLGTESPDCIRDELDKGGGQDIGPLVVQPARTRPAASTASAVT